MKAAVVLFAAALMTGCATTLTPPIVNTDLLHDEWFAPPTVSIDPAAAMAVSPAMRAYLDQTKLSWLRQDDRKRRLMVALYEKKDLRLDYDAAITRTAAEAFDARAGNCLALVMMTGAFAKELGLSVRYQVVVGDDAWERAADLYIAIGHLNMTLDDKPPPIGENYLHSDPVTVDFVPEPDGRRQRTRVIDERTVVAMFMNNRAVEAMTRGELDNAYWWARGATLQDASLTSAYITLAVVYRNRHQPLLAEAVLKRVTDLDPRNNAATSNLVLVLQDQGRTAEANALWQQLQKANPHPPFSYFNEGMAAMRAGHYAAARDLFTKEVDREPYYHEFQFWLAVAYFELDDPKRGTEHLARAKEVSTTRRDHDLYAVKLDKLKAFNESVARERVPGTTRSPATRTDATDQG